MIKNLVIANILVALLLGALISAETYADRYRTLKQAEDNARNLSLALSEQTDQLFARIKLNLKGVAGQSRGVLAGAPFSDIRSTQEFLNFNRRESLVIAMFVIVDDDGRLVLTDDDAVDQTISLAQSPEFNELRASRGNHFVIGSPRRGTLGRVNGEWILPVMYRLNGENGRFAGAVIAAVSHDYLIDLYATVRLGERGVVGLVRSDGALLARSPLFSENRNRDMAGSELFRQLQAGLSQGSFDSASFDQVNRLIAFSRLDDIDAALYVGVSRSEVLAPWLERTIFNGSITFLTWLIFAGASYLIARLTRQRRQMESQQRSRLHLLAGETVDLAAATDITQLARQGLDVARTLTGAKHANIILMPPMDYFLATSGAQGDDTSISAHPACRDAASRLVRFVSRTMLPSTRTRDELLEEFGGRVASDIPVLPEKCWLGLPIIQSDGERIGAVQLLDTPTGTFDTSSLFELTQLVNLLAVKIENLRSLEAQASAQAAADAATQETNFILTSISDGVIGLDKAWRLVYLNSEAERIFERSALELRNTVIWDAFPYLKGTMLERQAKMTLEQGVSAAFQFHHEHLDRWFDIRIFPHAKGMTVSFRDITERKEIDERLRQSQKMDAVGQLTGGVAHDFNNHLTVILGSADALLTRLDPAQEKERALSELIVKAGERAGHLTDQLLAFARRQPLDPKPLNIADVLSGMESLLRRSIGETVDIEIVQSTGAWSATADMHQLENAILNLAINARDAMENGGKLTIETANTTVDQSYADANGIPTGQYVVLAVSDTGKGMNEELLRRVFEPFFTTKAAGRGSGLGLSMVYGFAAQSGGQVKIYSEVGEGTTVRLYLPRAIEGTKAPPRAVEEMIPRGDEHILVVEDDDLVREHTVNSLRGLGYRVTHADSGKAAITRLETPERYDLLLTDVVLPGGSSGRQVAKQAAELRPGLKIVFMSGYTENSIVHHGRLDAGVMLLSKPFRLAELARIVRKALDTPDTGAAV